MDVDNQTPTLDDLPNEILIHILRFLRWQGLERAGQVSKRFLSLSRENALWICEVVRMRLRDESWPPLDGLGYQAFRTDSDPVRVVAFHESMASGASLSFRDYILGLRLQNVLTWLSLNKGRNLRLEFLDNDNAAGDSASGFPLDIPKPHFRLTYCDPREGTNLYELNSKEIMSRFYAPNTQVVCQELAVMLRSVFWSLTRPMTTPVRQATRINPQDPMTLILNESEQLPYYAIRLPLSKLLANPSQIWRSLVKLCWSESILEESFNASLEAMVRNMTSMSDAVQREVPPSKEDMQRFHQLSRLAIDVEANHPGRAVYCHQCHKIISLDGAEALRQTNRSGLAPFRNQRHFFCSHTCLVRNIHGGVSVTEQKPEKDSSATIAIPCSNSLCLHRISLHEAFFMSNNVPPGLYTIQIAIVICMQFNETASMLLYSQEPRLPIVNPNRLLCEYFTTTRMDFARRPLVLASHVSYRLAKEQTRQASRTSLFLELMRQCYSVTIKAEPERDLYSGLAQPFVALGCGLAEIRNGGLPPFLHNADAHSKKFNNVDCFCSLACRRSALYKESCSSIEHCLNGECGACFDIETSTLSLECFELIFMNRSGKEEHHGYVCNEECADAYLTQKAAKLLLHKRLASAGGAKGQ